MGVCGSLRSGLPTTQSTAHAYNARGWDDVAEPTDPETSSAPPQAPYDPLMLGVNYTDLDPRLIELKKAVVG